MRTASQPRSAQGQVESYTATLVNEAADLVIRGVRPHFIVYVVRNGLDEGEIEYDRLGAFFYTLGEAYEFGYSTLLHPGTTLFDRDTFHVTAVDGRDHALLRSLLCELTDSDMEQHAARYESSVSELGRDIAQQLRLS